MSARVLHVCQSSKQRFLRGKKFALLVCFGLLTFTANGCGYPAASPNNLRLIASLRTALSARNGVWLKANEDLMQKRHNEGAMQDAEFEAFQAIIQQAREGDWSGAEREAVKFQRAQRPTAEQIAQARSKQIE